MKLNKSVLYISSGTLARLTRFNKYSQLDVVRASFVNFTEVLPQDITWQVVGKSMFYQRIGSYAKII